MNIHSRVKDDRTTTNMTSKGQVLIPKALRDQVGLRPGAPVTVGLNDRGEVVVQPVVAETADERYARIRASIESVRGTLKTEFATTDEYMDDLRPYRHDAW